MEFTDGFILIIAEYLTIETSAIDHANGLIPSLHSMQATVGHGQLHVLHSLAVIIPYTNISGLPINQYTLVITYSNSL